MELKIRRCLHYGFEATAVQVAGADVAGHALIRQAEPQILQLVVGGAGPQVRVKPPQTGVLTSKCASDRTGLCARMSLRAP
jgi:hypothetical protein